MTHGDYSKVRWAVIRRIGEGEDLVGTAREVVNSIHLRRAIDGPPDLSRLDRVPFQASSVPNCASKYSSERVPAAVKQGMVRGGKYMSVEGGFGWLTELEAVERGDLSVRQVMPVGIPPRNKRREPAHAQAKV